MSSRELEKERERKREREKKKRKRKRECFRTSNKTFRQLAYFYAAVRKFQKEREREREREFSVPNPRVGRAR